MPRPANRQDLLDAANTEFGRLLAEVGLIDAEYLSASGACESWSVKDLLAHLNAWHEMFLEWEKAGSAGESVAMPAPGYMWKDTPALNESIYQRTKDDAFDAVMDRLSQSHQSVVAVLAGYTDADLFQKKRYKWTGSTSVGSYAVSATSSHYDWARQLIRKYRRQIQDG